MVVWPWSHYTHAMYINGLAQDYSNSSALAMELLQSCDKLLILPLQTSYEMPSVKPLQKLIVWSADHAV